MPNSRFTALVEQFFSDRISEHELLELDLMLKQDKGLREAFIDQVKLHRHFSAMAYRPKGMGERQRMFREILEKARPAGEKITVPAAMEMVPKAKAGHFLEKRRRFLAYGLAASLLLLLGATLFFQLDQSTPSLEKYRDLQAQVPQ